MKERLLHGWNFLRLLRALFAVVFLIAGIQGHEPVAYFAAAFFGVQAIFNIGCCGVQACAPRGTDAVGTKNTAREITYEEVT
ncbi:MAG: hypothetical protein WAU70_00880 [Flavobacteriales bacterium]